MQDLNQNHLLIHCVVSRFIIELREFLICSKYKSFVIFPIYSLPIIFFNGAFDE